MFKKKKKRGVEEERTRGVFAGASLKLYTMSTRNVFLYEVLKKHQVLQKLQSCLTLGGKGGRGGFRELLLPHKGVESGGS